jgi:hypothetical protein
MVGYGEHVGLEGGVSLEGGAVDGYMDIGGGAENPVVTGIAIFMGIFGLGIWWKGQKTGAMLTVAVVVGIEEAGDIGARFDRLWWQIASLVAEIKSHSVRCLGSDPQGAKQRRQAKSQQWSGTSRRRFQEELLALLRSGVMQDSTCRSVFSGGETI